MTVGKSWEELWEELENQAVEERAELGRDVYIHLPILPSSAQKTNSSHAFEYEEVMGLSDDDLCVQAARSGAGSADGEGCAGGAGNLYPARWDGNAPDGAAAGAG